MDIVHCGHFAFRVLCVVGAVYCGDSVHAVHEHSLLLRGSTGGQHMFCQKAITTYSIHDACHSFGAVCGGWLQDADIHIDTIMPV